MKTDLEIIMLMLNNNEMLQEFTGINTNRCCAEKTLTSLEDPLLLLVENKNYTENGERHKQQNHILESNNSNVYIVQMKIIYHFSFCICDDDT